MPLGSIGGLLVIGGCVLLVVSGAIAVGGGAVGIGVAGAGGLAVMAALSLAGSGAAVLSVSGRAPLSRRSTRIGLGLLAFGLLSPLVTANEPSDSPLILLLLVGGLALLIGAIVTVVSLMRSPGLPRRVGLLFLAGLILAALAGVLANGVFANTPLPFPLNALTGVAAIVGGSAMVLAAAGIGLLAVDGARTGGRNGS